MTTPNAGKFLLDDPAGRNPLGMHDSGCIGRQGQILVPLFLRNQTTHLGELRQRFLAGGHQGVAAPESQEFPRPIPLKLRYAHPSGWLRYRTTL